MILRLGLITVAALAAGCGWMPATDDKPAANGGAHSTAPAPQRPVAETAEEREVITFEAEVVRVQLEGGFWGLVTDEGLRYDPSALPVEFQQQGLRVRVTARVLSDVASFHMWGTLIQPVSVEKISGGVP